MAVARYRHVCWKVRQVRCMILGFLSARHGHRFINWRQCLGNPYSWGSASSADRLSESRICQAASLEGRQLAAFSACSMPWHHDCDVAGSTRLVSRPGDALVDMLHSAGVTSFHISWERGSTMQRSAPASEHATPTRKLVAILSVDVVGYSHLMEQNNHATEIY